MTKEKKLVNSSPKSASERRRDRISSQRKDQTRSISSANGRRRRTVRTTWWQRNSFALIGAILVAVVIVVGTFFIIANSPNQPSGSGVIGPTDPAILSKVTSVKQSVFANVGTAGQHNPFKAPAGNPSPLKGPDGKPVIFYYGTEWCPLCAAERWSMTIALSRFGTFKSLPLTVSADASYEPIEPNIPTFSFHGAEYSSNYIDFAPVELETRTKQPLDNPTADQQKILVH